MTRHTSVAWIATLRAVALAMAGLLGACPGDDAPAARWELVHRDLPSALFSVWGSSPSDVWAVGGDPGTGPLVIHYDGAAWKRHATGATGDLWWVHGVPGGPVFMGGKGGLVLRYDGATFERLTTLGTDTVFGIWGTGPDNVWAVGGTGREGGGFVWRFDGAAFQVVPLPEGAAAHTVFKVWGNGPDDILFVGSAGLMLKWDGTALAEVPSGTTRTMFTVHTLPGRAAAVGGFGNAVIMEPDPASGMFRDVAPPATTQMNGVWLTASGGYAVGNNVSVMRRDPAGWVDEDTGVALAEGLHGVWVDATGGVWAVGGQVVSEPFEKGIMIHRGVGSVVGGIDGL